MKRIVLLFTNYGPYHLSRISGFYQAILDSNYEVVGIELARYEAEYTWQAQLESLPFDIISLIQDKQLEQVSFSFLIKQLFSVLTKTNPDVLVIAGYARPAMLAALLWSFWYQKPAILLSATKKNDKPRNVWHESVKRWILKHYKAGLVGGYSQKYYLTELGMAPEAIFLGYNVVGNDDYHPEKIKSLHAPLLKPYFLAVNRFVPKKNLPFLISSYAKYRQMLGNEAWDLVICGDGYLRPQLEAHITKLALQNSVHLPGFLQQDELLPYFAHASCFIHASIQEQWGLVVNEAMAAGLPILLSKHCGCYEDLMIEGVNGFSFDPENSQQLIELMLKMHSEEVDLKAMGDTSLHHIQNYSPTYFAQGLIQAIEYSSLKGLNS